MSRLPWMPRVDQPSLPVYDNPVSLLVGLQELPARWAVWLDALGVRSWRHAGCLRHVSTSVSFSRTPLDCLLGEWHRNKGDDVRAAPVHVARMFVSDESCASCRRDRWWP